MTSPWISSKSCWIWTPKTVSIAIFHNAKSCHLHVCQEKQFDKKILHLFMVTSKLYQWIGFWISNFWLVICEICMGEFSLPSGLNSGVAHFVKENHPVMCSVRQLRSTFNVVAMQTLLSWRWKCFLCGAAVLSWVAFTGHWSWWECTKLSTSPCLSELGGRSFLNSSLLNYMNWDVHSISRQWSLLLNNVNITASACNNFLN